MNQKMTETTYGVQIKRHEKKKLACEIAFALMCIGFSIGVVWLLKGVGPKKMSVSVEKSK